MNATYPEAPGFKTIVTETSRQAAKKVAGKAETLRARVLEELDRRELTADEVAESLRPSEMTDVEFETFKRSVRSRQSELVAQGKVESTDKRRENSSGHSAVVWRSAKKLAQVNLF